MPLVPTQLVIPSRFMPTSLLLALAGMTLLASSLVGCGDSTATESLATESRASENQATEKRVTEKRAVASLPAEVEIPASDIPTTKAPSEEGDSVASRPRAASSRPRTRNRRRPIPQTKAPAPRASALPTRTGSVRELTFDDVKFEMEKNDDFKRSMITPEIESLNNQKIRISGFILPASVFRQQGIKQFVLVRDNQECCFGPGAALFDSIVIDMEPGKTTDFQIRPISVEGKFSIHEWVGPDGKHLSIYHLQASQAK